MGLVMFARYGGNSPLDKQYVKSKDQVSITKILFYLFIMSSTIYFVLYCYTIDGPILCHGHAAGHSWTTWTVCCMFI